MGDRLPRLPRQRSSGGKATLLDISKRRDSYLRTLLIHGAGPVIYAARRKIREGENWLSKLLARRNSNVASVALANKSARIVWTLLARNREFRADQTAQIAVAQSISDELSTTNRRTARRPKHRLLRRGSNDGKKGQTLVCKAR